MFLSYFFAILNFSSIFVVLTLLKRFFKIVKYNLIVWVECAKAL